MPIVETLGVFASTSQLAAYSIKIVLFLDEIYTEVQNRPNRTREHLNQVRELIEITNLIERRESLRSSVIHAQLEKTLSKARALYDILRDLSIKYAGNAILRVWTILSGVDDKVILTGLNDLEREKSALRLCISLVHTDLLLSIQGSIKTLSNREMPPNSCLDLIAMSKETGDINRENALVESKAEHQNEEKSHEASANAAKVEQKLDTTVSKSGHSYGEVTSINKGRLHAGDQNAEDSVKDAKSHVYQRVSCDDSLHVAGNMNSRDAIQRFYGKG